MGWSEEMMGILSVPDDPLNPESYTSLINTHGEVSIEQIRAFEESYINSKTRPAQDTHMLYKCLMGSLSKVAKKKILIWSDQYTIGDKFSGPLLLKVIIRESHLDTNATSTAIRTKMTKLDEYLPQVGYSVTKFNAHVKLLMEGLMARGEMMSPQDVLVCVFKGYFSCTDKDFCRYIRTKVDSYEEGTPISPDEIMVYANNKYKTLVEAGKYNVPDPSEEKLLVLQAKISKMESNAKRGKEKPFKNKESGKSSSNSQKQKGKSKPDWLAKQQKPKPDQASTSSKWN